MIYIFAQLQKKKKSTHFYKYVGTPCTQKYKKSSNKLRMKALVGWNTFYQHSKLKNSCTFLTRIKIDLHKELEVQYYIISCKHLKIKGLKLKD